MVDLKPEEFSDFFEALYGVTPFPWQERLAHRVFARDWPRALDIPTGAGKTAAIDIALFHLALEATRGSERHAALRILFVVDRRLIVDDAYRRARFITNMLEQASDGILKRVSERLGVFAEHPARPLMVARLRGGMPKEPDWVRTPAQPTVVVSTVDQAGSRLLFRGYGVSDTMKPVHAGLLGGDTLLLLDEAHLSQPFVQTARDSRIFRCEPWSRDMASASFTVVTLSATHAEDDAGEAPFRLTEEDRAHPELRRRLAAAKPTELVDPSTGGEAALVKTFADKAVELCRGIGESAVVAVVVNRVNRARAVFAELQRRELAQGKIRSLALEQDEAVTWPETALLIGRVRDLDRDKVLQALLRFVQAGSGREPRVTPLIVVATQCIEAGADLDFDAMVTEIAPLDCLRQRLGRLNRMGRDVNAQTAIVAAANQVKKSAPPDPIYGKALWHTWNLLEEKSETRGNKKDARQFIEFGIDNASSWLPQGDDLRKCLAPRKDAPVLMPSAVDFWSRTMPIPAADPDVALYLHGPETSVGDVEIVWRTDLDDAIDDTHEKERGWIERIQVCPPSTLESISVPFVEARRWLAGVGKGDIPDTDAVGTENPPPEGAQVADALRWRGVRSEDNELIHSGDLHPGDIIVVPGSRGGCDRWGWAPTLTSEVSDLGREANRQQRGRDILRFTRASTELGIKPETERTFAAAMEDWTNAKICAEFEKHFENDGKDRVLRDSDGVPLAIERRLSAFSRKLKSDASGEPVTEDDESVRVSGARRVTLSAHSKGVEDYARRFVQALGLPASLAEDVTLAAFLHDAGKAHPNFKCFLYGGDEIATFAGPDLAKSGKLPDSPEAWNEVRRRSGLPKGARHEMASLWFALSHRRFANAHDPDLVLWLIGTHHGYGRPFFPESDWPGQGAIFKTDLGDGESASTPARSLAELTAEWVNLWERVSRRYNPWGLARLEAILRLADHRRSEAEQGEELR
ncbi:MAG: type I-G CRISPR-associated helicase/endonuclease Cas3g [Candidatus Binataceae bacterium]